MADAALQRMSREEFLAWDAEQPDRNLPLSVIYEGCFAVDPGAETAVGP